ncbi:sugar transporter-domain-containing protein [Xylaria bambusicola]|uniref:sugar transporter-domain-containing protein n=1 Tax=Xylaria bambusicola TaxID=326684 RepID=UPI002007C8D1|nr:sugar transporter-domain-containing protein [Xylaria bambusicola]KAI0518483.1 sugar transporter-domain-containing protein [Xylaria bambusicola]
MSEKEAVSTTAGAQDAAALAPEPVHDAEKGRRGSAAHIDINKNVDAKIRNPLAGIPRQQLLSDVEAFARENNLDQHIPLLRKGALVAQDPTCFEDIQGAEALDEAEIYALKREITHKWSVPRTLYLTIITCSIGAAVQGWDQEGSNGANLTFPLQFGIGSNSTHDVFLVGLINSAPYIGSALIGCWCSDPLNNYFGRRGTIFISAIFCLITPIGGAVTQNWQQLLATRLLLGIGMGIKASTVPIFAAENSPASIRGALTMTWQMWTAFGIWLGTIANLVVGRVGPIAWRLQIGSAFIPAVPLVSLILFCPESPRWFIKKGRYAEAMTSLLKLRNNPIQAARDLYAIHAQVQVEANVIGKASYVTRFFELFTVPRLRRATGAAFVVMIAQQLCGINIIAFYSSTVFVAAGANNFQALLASFGFGAINFFFAFPAFWTIDTFGRRALLLFTFPNMAWSLLAAGLFNLLPEQSTTHVVLVAVFIYVFAAFYSPGEGPVPFAYSAEVFPLSHREVGMAFAVATNLFWAAVLSITFPKILDSLGVVGAFGLYAGFNVLGFVLIFLWVPETKQRTLEELDYIFAVPSTLFIKYQFTKALPWWFKRWVLWQKSATLQPLYQFDSPPVVVSTPEPARSSSVEKNHDSDAIATTTGTDIPPAGEKNVVQD